MVRKQAFDLDAIHTLIPPIFDQAQSAVANHRKNCVALYKIHVQAASINDDARNPNGAGKRSGERVFGDIFLDMMSRILGVKKGSANVEKVVKFVGSYVRFVTEKAPEEQAKATSRASGSNSEDSEETPNSRFVSRVLSFLLKGFNAKDKIVRFRVVSILSELLSHLGELDDDIYMQIRQNLTERVQDKETIIRTHAITALSKLLGSEDLTQSSAEGKMSILDVILDCLCHDPAAEVRRVALLHTPLLPQTLPSILTRTRDIDLLVRSYLYAHILSCSTNHHTKSASTSRRPPPNSAFNRLNDPTQLTLEQRLTVVTDGLGDREDKVRAAAAQMLGSWFEWVCERRARRFERSGNVGVKGEDGEGEEVVKTLVDFLGLFEVERRSRDDLDAGLVAADALGSVFLTKRGVVEAILFSDDYWKTLTPETVLIARVFIDYASQSTSSPSKYRPLDLIETSSFPVLTAFAFYIQGIFNRIIDVYNDVVEPEVDTLGDSDDGDNRRPEESVREKEVEWHGMNFVLNEMLKIAIRMDFSDGNGRKKALLVVRDMLADEALPEQLFEPCIDILKETTSDERELIKIGVEIINELKDSRVSVSATKTQDPDGSTQISSASSSTATTSSQISRRPIAREEVPSENQARDDESDSRCLALCSGILKHINGTFDENSTLEEILADLILPAVKSCELVLRERGLVSLGLCCLISKKIAMSSFQLFIKQVQDEDTPEDLKLKTLKIIFDVLMMYDEELLNHSKEITDGIIQFLLQALQDEDLPAVQALLCLGISKLMLNGVITDERLLTSLVLAYVTPATVDNQELRQCLSYFLPIYCYSSPSNQSRMQSVFIMAFDLVTKLYRELEEEDEMIAPLQFGILFLDWTNPQKAAGVNITGVSQRDVHVDLAVDILKAVYDADCIESNRKVLCQLLSKLYFPERPDKLSLYIINLLYENLVLPPTTNGSPTSKLLNKFITRFKKQYSRIVESFDVRQYSSDKHLQEVCAILGVELGAEDGEGSRVKEEEEGEEEEVDQLESSPVPETPYVASTRRLQTPLSHDSSEDEHEPMTPVLESPPRGPFSRSRPVPQRPRKMTPRLLEPLRHKSPSRGPPTSESDTEDDEPLPTPSSPHVGGGIPTPPGYRTSLKRTRSPDMSDVDSPSFKRLNKGKNVVIPYPPTPSPSRAGTSKLTPLTSDGPNSDEYDSDDDVLLTTSWKGKYRRSAAPSLRASSGHE